MTHRNSIYLNALYKNNYISNNLSINFYSTSIINNSTKCNHKESKTSDTIEVGYSGVVKESDVKIEDLTTGICHKHRKIIKGPIINVIDKKSKTHTKAQDKQLKIRYNDFNIQMISQNLYEQLFGDINQNSSYVVDETVIKKCVSELRKYNLMSKQEVVSDVKLNLPKFEGKNITEHFWNIGEKQSGPYKTLLEDLITGIPDIPKKWLLESGWTRYTEDGHHEKVDFPKEDALIMDVEVCLAEGDMPTLATAVTNKAWYGWVSPDLVNINNNNKKNITNKVYSIDQLIPLESDSKANGYKLNDELKKPRIVVGHNVSFDRARVKEQYWLERTGLRFMDTMSMHISVSGVTSYQKALLKSDNAGDGGWKQFSSLNNLSKVHELYCGTELSKEKRDTFISGSLNDVYNEFDSLIEYCANDSLATYRVLCKLLPMFLMRFPHPVTLAGMLELGLCYLPVNSNWKRYIDDANRTYSDLENETKYLLTQRANEACQLLNNDEYKNNMWLWDQDWTIKQLSLKKTVSKSTKVTKRKSKKDKTDIVEDPIKNECTEEEIVKIQNDNSQQNGPNTPTCNLLLNEVIEKSRNHNDEFDDLSRVNTQWLEEKFKDIMDKKELLPVRIPLLPGYPAWYRKLCSKPKYDNEWSPGPNLISTGMQVSSKLLSLTWKSMPLHYIRGHGWGYLVPYETSIMVNDEKGLLPKEKFYDYCVNVNSSVLCNCEITSESESNGRKGMDNLTLHENIQNHLVKFLCSKNSFKKKNISKSSCNADDVFCKAKIYRNKIGFIKLPHKNGTHLNVGNPLAKDFVFKFSENELGSSDIQAQRIINISRMLSYWRNHSDRVEEQIVMWLCKKDVRLNLRNKSIGVILPQVVVSGTLTRRAVERTWMTASNAVDERVGSELRAMIQTPPGYSFVGADVDAQELWIASVIGDAYAAKQHGATPFGWMTLSGQKSDGTDMHSVTAKAVGITRSDAKVINYARIYGAGQPFAERLLKQFNPDMTLQEAREKARKMFSMTKGMRVFKLKDDILPDIPKRIYTRFTANELCKLHNKSVDELFYMPKWSGGSESAMFNRLEEIACNPEPKTPFLQCRLSRALEPHQDVEDRFVPTRVNWVVQSGAVDFLHLMLVSMRWLLGPEPRFCLSFHDEIRYIVKDNMKYQTALALHVTNALVRSFCVQQLGMVDLPRSVAFFSSVEVDTVLRKEAHNDCVTPSNPYGLSKGYGIPLGESLTIDQAILKANGVIGIHKCSKKDKCIKYVKTTRK